MSAGGSALLAWETCLRYLHRCSKRRADLMITDMAVEVERLTEQALALPPALRELVAYRIWESLHPGESCAIAPDQAGEIRRKANEIETGTAELIDGDDVLRAARARIAARR
jgi:hypothetical protein